MSALSVDPTHQDNAMNPWIWRRQWILGNPGITQFGSSDPQYQVRSQKATSEYGSVLDGPHIDSKVKRFINREHRLFMVVNVLGLDSNALDVTGDQELGVFGVVDLRVHGQLARQRNTSSF